MKKQRNPLGKFGPWSWALEPVRGCNLRCGHCAVREFTDPWKFMDEATWRALFETIAVVSPSTRVEMAQAGEPTLHPRLLEFLSIARELSPYSQLQVTTNGTKLIDGELTYRDLFEAGANIVYTDMYAPPERHVKLAQESGYQWYAYHEKEWEKSAQTSLFSRSKTAGLPTSSGDGRPNCWTYHGPDLKLIVLMENPAQWPESRKNLNRLGTFFNHLDWKASKRFGLEPVTEPLQRGCSQPFRYVVVHVSGAYQLCCQDFWAETVGKSGSVHGGPKEFIEYWFSEFMQGHRKGLRKCDRAGSPYCSRCSITFARTDWQMWNEKSMDAVWDGEQWLSWGKAPMNVGEELPSADLLLSLARQGITSATAIEGEQVEAERSPRAFLDDETQLVQIGPK